MFSGNFNASRLFFAEPALKKYGKIYHALRLYTLLAIRYFFVHAVVVNKKLSQKSEEQQFISLLYANAFQEMSAIVRLSENTTQNTASKQHFHNATHEMGMIFLDIDRRKDQGNYVKNWVQLYKLLIQLATIDNVNVPVLLPNARNINTHLNALEKKTQIIASCDF